MPGKGFIFAAVLLGLLGALLGLLVVAITDAPLWVVAASAITTPIIIMAVLAIIITVAIAAERN